MSGKVITTEISSIRELKCDEIWQITRGGPDIKNTIRVRNLSPSEYLFSRYRTEWSEKEPIEWWGQYKEIFQRELETEEKLVALRNLYKKVKTGKTIALVCFCKDSQYCHRSLIAQFLSNCGVEVEELKIKKTSSSEQKHAEQLSLIF